MLKNAYYNDFPWKPATTPNMWDSNLNYNHAD